MSDKTNPTPTELLALADEMRNPSLESRILATDTIKREVVSEWSDRLRTLATTLSAREDDAKDAARWRFMANEENIHNPSRINAVVNRLVESGGSWTDKATWDTAIDSMLAKAPTAGEGHG